MDTYSHGETPALGDIVTRIPQPSESKTNGMTYVIVDHCRHTSTLFGYNREGERHVLFPSCCRLEARALPLPSRPGHEVAHRTLSRLAILPGLSDEERSILVALAERTAPVTP